MGVSLSGLVPNLTTWCPLWAKQMHLSYADKGVVFSTDLVILATQSTKKHIFLIDVLPHMHLQSFTELKYNSAHALTAAADDKARQMKSNLTRWEIQVFLSVLHCWLFRSRPWDYLYVSEVWTLDVSSRLSNSYWLHHSWLWCRRSDFMRSHCYKLIALTIVTISSKTLFFLLIV